MQGYQNRIDRGEDVRLGPTEGGKPQRGQPELQRAKVAATEGKVMQEVPGAVSIVRVNFIETWLRHGRGGDHIRPDGCELFQDALNVRPSRASAISRDFRFHKHLLLRHFDYWSARLLPSSVVPLR